MPTTRRAYARARRISTFLPMVLLATLAIVTSGSVIAATPVTVGWRDDVAYGAPASPGGDDVTANRSQSKLWTNDGFWFGVRFDPISTPAAKFRIWRFNMATQNWTNTNVPADDRNRSHADALSDGNVVYLASARAEGPAGSLGRDLRIFKYTYNTATDTYAAVAGFPKLIPNTAAGTGFSTIAKDADGELWVAFTQANRVRITSSTDNGVTWSAPIDLPNMGNNITVNDTAAIATMTGGVGVLWSNQSADDAFYFVAHRNVDPAGTWMARETAFSKTDPAYTYDADGHISLKTDAAGNLLAAVKTNRNDDPAPNGGDPLITVLKRTGAADAAGSWASHPVTNVTVGGTRPILVIDDAANEANVFLTNPEQAASGQQSIYRRTAPLSTLNFGAASIGTPFIQSATEVAINDATSTKQRTTAATGILVEATNIPTRHYLHNCVGGPCPVRPVANFTGTPTSGTAPLTVQFTDTSTNSPTSWSWTFGDGGTSTAKNPSHVYADPGTYTVTLTAANLSGGDSETKTSYITVQVPPETVYTAMTPPRRVLDTRPGGVGLSGTFKPDIPRTLSVAGSHTIPADAVAITGNLTVVGQTRAGYLAITPNPTAKPPTSSLNFPVGDIRANGVTVPLNASGDLSIVYKAAGGSTHVVLDVTGYFREATNGATYFPLTAPKRALDSRIGTGLSGTFRPDVPRLLSIAPENGIPATAVAITGNLTVVGQTRAGYLAITPARAVNPPTSSLNFPLGDVRANGVTVPLNASGDIWIVYKAAGGSTHVVLDVTGYFLPGTTGATFVPLTPARILDTRSGNGLANPFTANQWRTWDVAGRGGVGSTAAAVIGNVTVVGQTKAGYVALTPAVQANLTTSTINFPLGDIRANNFTVRLSGAGSLSGIYKAATGAKTHLVVDVTGYYK